VLLVAVPLMPTGAAAAAMLVARFLCSQMDVPARQAKLLDMFGDEELKEEFLDLWARKDEPGLKRWQGLTGKVETKFKKHVSTIVEIVFTYTYGESG
jgi:hypothetical protein